jgi:hypothetical protein
MFYFDRRQIFRSLKYKLIDVIKGQDGASFPLHTEKAIRPKVKHESWVISIVADSFSSLFPNKKWNDPRSLLLEIEPEKIAERENFGFPDPAKSGPYRLFIIYLNSDQFSGVEVVPTSEHSLLRLELILRGVAHEIHYIEMHHTLFAIYERKVYESVDKAKYKNPVTESEYNLICSMQTICRGMAHVEQTLGVTFFSNESEYSDAAKLAEDQRPGWLPLLQYMASTYFISRGQIESELKRMFEILVQFGGIPRLPNNKIDLDKINSIEDSLKGYCDELRSGDKTTFPSIHE